MAQIDACSICARLVSECLDIVEHGIIETRAMSHLLHPPLLEERGLCSAIRLFAEGFARHGGLSVALDLPSDFDPGLIPDMEIALFRSVQEGLTVFDCPSTKLRE